MSKKNVNMAFYRPEGWNRLLSIIDDKEVFHDTSEQWHKQCQTSKKQLESQGFAVNDLVVGINDLIRFAFKWNQKWCHPNKPLKCLTLIIKGKFNNGRQPPGYVRLQNGQTSVWFFTVQSREWLMSTWARQVRFSFGQLQWRESHCDQSWKRTRPFLLSLHYRETPGEMFVWKLYINCRPFLFPTVRFLQLF